MIENRVEEWEALTREFGEALLDVERTFLETIDRQAAFARNEPIDSRSDPVFAYLEAWTRLDAAHRSLLPYLAAFSTRHMESPEPTARRDAVVRLQAVRAVGR